MLGILDFIFESPKKFMGIVLVIVVGLVINGFVSSAANKYFVQIESTQGVERVDTGFFSSAANIVPTMLSSAFGAKTETNYNGISENSKVEGDVEGVSFDGRFVSYLNMNNSLLNTGSPNYVIVKIEKYFKDKTYKIPVNMINISLKN